MFWCEFSHAFTSSSYDRITVRDLPYECLTEARGPALWSACHLLLTIAQLSRCACCLPCHHLCCAFPLFHILDLTPILTPIAYQN